MEERDAGSPPEEEGTTAAGGVAEEDGAGVTWEDERAGRGPWDCDAAWKIVSRLRVFSVNVMKGPRSNSDAPAKRSG